MLLYMPPFVLSDPKAPIFLLRRPKIKHKNKTSPRKLDHNPRKTSLLILKTRSMSSGEFGSNESGWTKYLGSPSQEEGNHSSGVDDDECNYYYYQHQRYDLISHRGKHSKDSDDNDSVASDASSGPSHHKAFVARNINGGGCSKEEQDCFYAARKPSMGEEKVKGKAAKEPAVLDHKGKKGISSLRHKLQKRGKKAN